MNLRSARPDESEALTSLAFASKALWGYSREQLDAWADELRISPQSITREPTFVAEEDGSLLGVLQLGTGATPWEVECLWVHPAAVRRGIGTSLMRKAVAYARAHGVSRLHIDADPHAEAFYLRMGARRVGERSSPITGEPDRVRPQLLLDTASGG